MSKGSSARYYQKTKKKFKKSLVKDKYYCRRKKAKSENIVRKDIRTSQKMQNRGLLSIEKDITNANK